MLKLFMDAIGPFSKKMLKRHFISYERLQLHPHFETETLAFRRHDVDKVTGQKVIRVVMVTNPVFAKQIGQIMIKARSDTDQRGDVMRLADLLAKCLVLDPGKRIAVHDALKHDFFAWKNKNNQNVQTDTGTGTETVDDKPAI